MTRTIVNSADHEFQGMSRYTYYPDPDGVWTPEVVTYPAAGIYSPADVTRTDDAMVHFDPAINDTECLVLANSIGGLGATPRVAYALWDLTSLRGSVRAEVQMTSFTVEGSSPDTYGVFALASGNLQPDAGGQAYALVANDAGSESRLFLVQVTDGLDYSIGQPIANTFTILGETPQADFGTRAMHVFELRWEVDAVLLKGVRLRAFFDDELLWDIVYTGADAYIPTSSTGVGVFATAVTHETVHYFDNVQGRGAA